MPLSNINNNNIALGNVQDILVSNTEASNVNMFDANQKVQCYFAVTLKLPWPSFQRTLH